MDAVRAVLDAGLRPRLHLEDATPAPREFVFPFFEAVQEVAARYPEVAPPKFRICDTMGLGLPFEPVDVPQRFGCLRDRRSNRVGDVGRRGAGDFNRLVHGMPIVLLS